MERGLLWGLIGSAALGWSGSAVAAEETDAPEIIVTGEKAKRSLQDTITSVAVTTPQRIREENLVTLQDLLQRTANVTDSYYTGGFSIRGIAERGIKGGEGAALATIFVDAAAIPSTVVQAAPAEMWDVAQIEILRGPQSTLQGLNTLAGAVIVSTAEPTMVWSMRGRAMVTNQGETQFAAAAGGPLVADALAFRVTIEKRDRDGIVWNPTRRAHEDALHSTQVRAKLLWTPVSLPGFEARLGFTRYDRTGGYSFGYVESTTPAFFDHRRNFSNDPNDSRAKVDIVTADLRYDLGGGFRLSAILAYNAVRETSHNDLDQTSDRIATYGQDKFLKTLSQELRINFEGQRFSGLVGAFVYRRTGSIETASTDHIATPLPTIVGLLRRGGLDTATAQWVAGLYGQALPTVPVDFTAQASDHVTAYALFGDARVMLTDRLALLGGFRYDRETSNLAIDQRARFVGTYPDPRSFGLSGSPLFLAVAAINQGVDQLVTQASGSTAGRDRTFGAFLPKVGVEMAWTRDIKTAFTLQKGYRSGGLSSNVARSQTFAYDPEFTWNYELAFRSAWLDGKLLVNANAFYVDWKQQQILANFGLSLYDTNIVNAGKSHLYGFEIETTHRPGRDFDLYTSIGYTRTKFDDFTTTVGGITDFEGLEFAHAPRWTLAGGINLRPQGNIRINLNASHRTAILTDVRIPQSATRAAGRTLVNARIAYEAKHWTLSAFASNILNDSYYQYRFEGMPRAVLGDPRVVGVTLEAHW